MAPRPTKHGLVGQRGERVEVVDGFGDVIDDHDAGRRGGSLAGAGELVAGPGEPVGFGAGFDDVAAEGESVDDRGAESRVGECLVKAEKASFEAMATEAFSSRSVRTWKSSSAPRLSSSM